MRTLLGFNWVTCAGRIGDAVCGVLLPGSPGLGYGGWQLTCKGASDGQRGTRSAWH